MSVGLYKIAARGNRMSPLGLACLQGFLKARGVPVEVGVLIGDYRVEAVLASPFERPRTPRLVPNHQDLPLLLACLDALQSGRGIDLDVEPFPDLLLDRAVLLFESPRAAAEIAAARIRFARECAEAIAERGHTVVGLSLDYTNVLEAGIASAWLKRLQPSLVVVWGGPTVTQSHEALELFLEAGIVDVLVRGEGEAALLDIVEKGNPGACAGSVVQWPESLDLDSLPAPDWSGIDPARFGGRMSVYTSRGCTHRCTFCAEWRLLGCRFRRRSAARVGADVAAAAALGPRYLVFGDSLVNQDRDDFEALCAELERVRNGCGMGAHFRADVTPELARVAAEAGFGCAWVGVESLSDRSLVAVKKGVDAAASLEGVRALAEAGLVVVALLVVGVGGVEAERESYRNVLEVIEQIRSWRVRTGRRTGRPVEVHWRPSPRLLVPGSRDYQRCRERETRPWRPGGASRTGREALGSLSARLDGVPYTWHGGLEDALVSSVVRGILEADRLGRCA
jgi:hypothetical protein